MFDFIKKHPRFIRLTNWEYWAMWQVYLPIVPYYIYLSLRARSLFFWSTTNPAIEYAGMLGQSKMKIMDLVPEHLKPKTVFLPSGRSFVELKKIIIDSGLQLPFFIKPDIGRRGKWATKIDDWQVFSDFLRDKNHVDFMAQAFLDMPEEFSVLHYRLPDERASGISSLTLKIFLKVVGDGSSSIRQLIMQQTRAILQLERLKYELGEKKLERVPAQGEVVRLGVVGNHCLGTEFINGHQLIDNELLKTFDNITTSLGEVYFARYDLKCTSLEDLKAGRNIKIMEVNGAGAEPAHIYDKNYSLVGRYRDLFHHFYLLFKIGSLKHRLGMPYMTFSQFRKWWQFVNEYEAKIS